MPKKKNTDATAAISQPLTEHPAVKEFLTLLDANNLPAATDFINLIVCVDEMERQLEVAVAELQSMRKEIAAIREESHPLKTALQSAVKALERNIAVMRERVEAVKQEIVSSCRDALAAVRDKGLSALRNVADFFKFRPALEAVRQNVDRAIREDNRAIALIDNISAEYHKAGRAVKNIGRAVVGKEAIQEAKAPGRVAKALQAPIRAERRCLGMIGNCLDTAINATKRLEQMPRREPVMETLDKMRQKAQQAERDAPTRTRQRAEPAHESR